MRSQEAKESWSYRVRYLRIHGVTNLVKNPWNQSVQNPWNQSVRGSRSHVQMLESGSHGSNETQVVKESRSQGVMESMIHGVKDRGIQLSMRSGVR